MNIEQKAALTRLHQSDDCEESSWRDYLVDSCREMPYSEQLPNAAEDVIAAAELALQEHPADEDEAITAEWRLSVSSASGPDWVAFGETFTITFKPHHYDPCDSAIRPAWVYQDTNGEEAELPTPKNRGDLRKLCQALGVELKESAS